MCEDDCMSKNSTNVDLITVLIVNEFHLKMMVLNPSMPQDFQFGLQYLSVLKILFISIHNMHKTLTVISVLR